MFTTADDVIRGREIPREFAAVLSGHIHRHQVLTVGLDGQPLSTPVLYPGSIERTSFAELDEPKGFMLLSFDFSERECSPTWEFRRLPARPMQRHAVDAGVLDARGLASAIESIVHGAPVDAVLGIRVTGALSDAHWQAISPARLRAVIPQTMNVEIHPANGFPVNQLRDAVLPAAELQLAL